MTNQSVAATVRGLRIGLPGVGAPVRGVDFELRVGRTLALLGESGSGKTLTARSLLGLHPRGARVTGSVDVIGRELLGLGARQLADLRGAVVALVPQDPSAALDPLRSVGHQIAEVLLRHRRESNRRRARRRAEDLLDLVGIADPGRVARARPHELSGGMCQRVAIAIAVSCSPAVLVGDEPTTALDVTVQAQILDLFRRLQDELGLALLLVTHDVTVAREAGDEIAVMYAGRILERGPTASVLDHPEHPYTAALLGSLPSPLQERGSLRAIPGSAPALDAVVEGACAFAPRCARVHDACRAAEPDLLPVANRHEAACHASADRAASPPFPRGGDGG